ncbi:MAG: cobyric acid synthase [Candidatus Methanomethylophilaceae archaeon]|nr:cobyric acid synthase [Candidatus Methanomethylophilaceae archaeon]
MKLMFLGTSSNAGKTLLNAIFCRYLSDKGIDTVPFKGSNLSLNSVATRDGKEIGIGQAFQAMACVKEPTGDMNPILLKPSGKGVVQVITNGKPYANISPGCAPDTEELVKIACGSFDRLSEAHDAVICEGSGSPVELNLKSRDVANLRMVRERKIPAVLVGDIERGGVFAAIYGTWLLMTPEEKKYVKGFIINRFRGEPSILKSGIERIENLTGMKCLGIVPYLDLRFPEEDSMSSKKGKLVGDDVRQAFNRNLDEMISVIKNDLDFEAMERMASEEIN